RVEILGRVTVPQDAAQLTLLLLSHGADENAVVTFDDVRVYRDPLDPAKTRADAPSTDAEAPKAAE
ncbi:MAG: hypothetical protein IKU86_03350, partial [Thermoguttaceae bacterium]|nr:hypothetical protein [Thermoguttaceae bacterium]